MALSLDGTTGITSDGGTPVIENLDTTATGIAVTGELTTTGNVGIGTSSPSRQLVVNGASSSSFIKLMNNTSGGTINDGFDLAFDGATVYYANREAGNHIFEANGAERARITSDGYFRMASGSGGIQFNGDTAAANALDDYEEGHWTPTVDNGLSVYFISDAKYVKIGNFVHVYGYFGVRNSTGATVNGYRVYGLPYACVNYGPVTHYYGINRFTGDAYVEAGSTFMITNDPIGTGDYGQMFSATYMTT